MNVPVVVKRISHGMNKVGDLILPRSDYCVSRLTNAILFAPCHEVLKVDAYGSHVVSAELIERRRIGVVDRIECAHSINVNHESQVKCEDNGESASHNVR